MALIIMSFDVVGMERRGDRAGLIEVADIAEKIGIVGYPPDIAFEMTDIDKVETQQRRQQPDVGLGEAIAAQVAAVGQPLLKKIERLEQRADRLLISLLSRREARAVDAVVQRRVDARIERVDFAA